MLLVDAVQIYPRSILLGLPDFYDRMNLPQSSSFVRGHLVLVVRVVHKPAVDLEMDSVPEISLLPVCVRPPNSRSDFDKDALGNDLVLLADDQMPVDIADGIGAAVGGLGVFRSQIVEHVRIELNRRTLIFHDRGAVGGHREAIQVPRRFVREIRQSSNSCRCDHMI